jgi:hypothetical protein
MRAPCSGQLSAISGQGDFTMDRSWIRPPGGDGWFLPQSEYGHAGTIGVQIVAETIMQSSLGVILIIAGALYLVTALAIGPKMRNDWKSLRAIVPKEFLASDEFYSKLSFLLASASLCLGLALIVAPLIV